MSLHDHLHSEFFISKLTLLDYLHTLLHHGKSSKSSVRQHCCFKFCQRLLPGSTEIKKFFVDLVIVLHRELYHHMNFLRERTVFDAKSLHKMET